MVFFGWSENGSTFCPFWHGTTGVYECICYFSSKINTEKERARERKSVTYKFEVDFKKSFILRFNLSNDDIIS